jgi:hypothetical protein
MEAGIPGALAVEAAILIMVGFGVPVLVSIATDTDTGGIVTMGIILVPTTETRRTMVVCPRAIRILTFCPSGQSKRHSRGTATTAAG